jgi:hypothetical protein
LDSAARAAYIRFSGNKVIRTEPVTSADCIVTLDFVAENNVVGIELVGVSEFGIHSLIKKSGLRLSSKHAFEKARYVPASAEAIRV